MKLKPELLFNFRVWRLVCFVFCCCFFQEKLWAQAVPDTSLNQVIPDSARAEQQKVLQLPNDASGKVFNPKPWQPNPKKAGLYSAMLPGAGQAYNKQYWKIPVIYAGVAAAGYFYFFNRDKYRLYRSAYISRIDNDPATTDAFVNLYSTGSLKQLQDGFKRYLDLTVLFTALGYTIQVLDAIAFAHLRNFDISPDLSLRIQPVVAPNGGIGLGLVAKF